jgi:hypothetical protein
MQSTARGAHLRALIDQTLMLAQTAVNTSRD